MDPIYLDYNATTPIEAGVSEAMMPFLSEYFGNPSSMHAYGIKTKTAVMEARARIASLIGCKPSEVVFTSGGTESNNYAIKGAAFANREKGNHIITSSIEHPAVLEVCKYLEQQDFEVTYLPVDADGLVDVVAVEEAIRPTTILITIMHANNEVGTIQPIELIGRMARDRGIVFHTDAAQSLGKIKVDVGEMRVDLLSVAGHKLYAPKGIGALYVRNGIRLDKLMHGADHEMNHRAGTENVLEIVGLGKACELAAAGLEENHKHLKLLRDRLYDGIRSEFPQVKLNGHPENRLPNTLSVSFPGIEANTLVSELKEVAVSAGAACHTDSIDISSVLLAMGVPQEYAMGTIRMSTGKMTTEEEIDRAIGFIVKVVRRLSGNNDQAPAMLRESKEIKLTDFTHGMGCACKIRPQYLEQALKDLPLPLGDPNVLVSQATADDAAVYRINDETALIQTVDFFTPIVDDPYDFGAIAAANAISDVYAMGGTPVFALNIVGFPDNRLPMEVLKAILKGASDKAKEAGIHILGGHTVEDTEPKFGMTVTGLVHPDKIIRNDTVQAGDALVLTKPLGTGILSTALKAGLLGEAEKKRLVKHMSKLNAGAAEIMRNFPVDACTDITGFGLLGHLSEMIVSGQFQVTLDYSSIPFMDQVESLAANGSIPGGSLNNRKYVEKFVEYGSGISEIQKLMLNDAQTSGGLLIAIPDEYAPQLVDQLHAGGILESCIVGRVINKGIGKIFVG